MTRAVLPLALWPASANAQPREPAGPALPPPERGTPAERAIRRYDALTGVRVPARPCNAGRDDIVVCAPSAGESSPYRLPLAGEAGGVDDDRRRMRGNPGPPAIGRTGIAPVVTFGVKLKTKL